MSDKFRNKHKGLPTYVVRPSLKS